MRLLAALLLAAAPAWADPPACPFPGQTPMLVVQLFFGQSIKGVGLVSRRAWDEFVADTITPSLPDGFTVYDARGQYLDKDTNAIGREPTEVVVVAGADTPDFRAHVAHVADAYRRRFRQGAVGLVSLPGCGAF